MAHYTEKQTARMKYFFAAYIPAIVIVVTALIGIGIMQQHHSREMAYMEAQRLMLTLIDPNGKPAWIASAGADRVSVLDLRTMEITGEITAGHTPDGLAFVAR